MDIQWTNLYKVLNEYADYWVLRAQEHIRQNGNVASGLLNETMGQQREVSFDVESGNISVKINLEPYWYYVENGRGPGKFPPIDKIKEWIEVKPVIPQVMTLTRHTKTKGDVTYEVLPSVSQLAFLIGRKIATEGTQGHPFFKQTTEEAIAHFELAIALALEEDFLSYVEQNVMKDLEKIL